MILDDIIYFIKANRKNGRRECFAWEDDCLEMYIKWAFCHRGLLLSLKNSQINGVAIVYPLPKEFKGSIVELLPSDEELEQGEKWSDLCVMDWIATDSESRKNLISQFQERFPYWESQKKYGVQFGKPKLLTNKYMNILKGLN